VRRSAITIVFVGIIGCASNSRAQDLEPRAYAASPIGANFIVVGGTRSTGDVLVDPSAPVQDVRATTNLATVGAGTTFALFGRTALVFGTFPYAWATATGRVGETQAEISRSGLADPRIKLSVNLLGGRALTPSEFARAERPTIAGVSLTVSPPLGQYDPTKLVNLGANRWAFKPEAGVSHLIGKWTIDGYLGAWLFTANRKYYTGSSTRTQDPIYALQGHVSYTVKPRFWTAFDATWYSGGTTIVDGMAKGAIQRNTRLGATLSVPLTLQQSVKVAVSKGATTRSGSDFTTLSAVWQYSWLD
jgi:hypothetical protein